MVSEILVISCRNTNVLIVLLFFFWYCHKRGKETRLAKEQGVVNGEGRITELDDDPMIEASGSGTPHETGNESSGKDTDDKPKGKNTALDPPEGAKSSGSKLTKK